MIQLMQAQNPIQMMQQMFPNNPMLNRALEMSNGKSEKELKQTVDNLSKQSGFNMDGLFNMAKNLGLRL